MAKRVTGNRRNVYVSTDLPVDLDNPTAYDEKVGLRTTVGLSSQAQSVTITDADGSSILYGENTVTNTLGVNYDATQDDGVTILRVAHFDADKPELWFLETSGIAGEEYVTYRATVGGYTEAHQVDSAATQSFTLGIDAASVTFGTNA